MSVGRYLGVAAALALALAAPSFAQTTTDEAENGRATEPSAGDGAEQPLREGDPVLKPEKDLGDRVYTPPTVKGVAVVVRGLDKFTGERVTLEIKIGESAKFQRINVEAKACYARVSSRSAEASAFLQIFDAKTDPATRVFSGWMFSASPAISALDHPRYDFWVASCKTS